MTILLVAAWHARIISFTVFVGNKKSMNFGSRYLVEVLSEADEL